MAVWRSSVNPGKKTRVLTMPRIRMRWPHAPTPDPTTKADIGRPKNKTEPTNPNAHHFAQTQKIIWEDFFRYEPMGLAINLTAHFFMLVKLYFANLTCCYKVASFELELDTCTSRTRLVLQRVHFAFSKRAPRRTESDSTHPKCAEGSLNLLHMKSLSLWRGAQFEKMQSECKLNLCALWVAESLLLWRGACFENAK